jgi:competence protein ComFC
MTTVAGKLQEWFSAGLGLIYPEVCQLCHGQRAALRDGLVCGRCRSQVSFIRPPRCERCGLPFAGEITTQFECTNCREMDLHFSSARSAVVAKSTVLDAIHQYKYSHAHWFEPFLAGLLLEAAVPGLREQDWNLIIPVPLHPLKFREREFNQAARLARHLGTATGISVDERSLRRVAPTRTQTKLSRTERAKNMSGAFAVREGIRMADKKIVLVDDVFTTGATTNACARALRSAGAADVCVWTVARGL